ncbi:hypothetical protein QB910_000059 [Dabrowskivirus KKP3916]|uniref:Uncharacterized protein n=1 Tax=Alicyclobacillus phage KKP_3916 TaxID=3040651 RepID=A0AAT9V7J3_9CAUD|nr:hypothetical protein QB910_000059 [Alicyclobacillus phage KKP 3916]
MAHNLPVVRCPRKECGHLNGVKVSKDHYVLVICEECDNQFWANPRSAKAKKLLMAVGKNPDTYSLIHREQIDELVDMALLIGDVDGARSYTNAKISNPDSTWFVSHVDEFELRPLIEFENQEQK